VTGAVTDALPGVIARMGASRKLRGPPAHAPRVARRDYPTGAQEATPDAAALASPPSRLGRAPQRPLPARRVPG
jgi:hypothetical protein